MSHTLSQKLNLRVNDFQLALNMRLNETELRRHHIKKIGFFDKLIIKPLKEESIYWAKNPELKYINENYENAIMPILNISAGAGTMFGTTAYFYFVKNILAKFVFQIIQNNIAAKMFLERFEKELKRTIGKASIQQRNFKIWQVENEKLILEFPQHKQHGYIHLLSNYYYQ